MRKDDCFAKKVNGLSSVSGLQECVIIITGNSAESDGKVIAYQRQVWMGNYCLTPGVMLGWSLRRPLRMTTRRKLVISGDRARQRDGNVYGWRYQTRKMDNTTNMWHYVQNMDSGVYFDFCTA